MSPLHVRTSSKLTGLHSSAGTHFFKLTGCNQIIGYTVPTRIRQMNKCVWTSYFSERGENEMVVYILNFIAWYHIYLSTWMHLLIILKIGCKYTYTLYTWQRTNYQFITHFLACHVKCRWYFAIVKNFFICVKHEAPISLRIPPLVACL